MEFSGQGIAKIVFQTARNSPLISFHPVEKKSSASQSACATSQHYTTVPIAKRSRSQSGTSWDKARTTSWRHTGHAPSPSHRCYYLFCFAAFWLQYLECPPRTSPHPGAPLKRDPPGTRQDFEGSVFCCALSNYTWKTANVVYGYFNEPRLLKKTKNKTALWH